MTQIDEVIGAALKDLGIKRHPALLQADGVLFVKEMTTKIGCVVETFYSVQELSNGLLRVKSFLYFFSKMKDDIDILGDVNPKLENIIANIILFKRKLKTAPLAINYPDNELQTFRFRTTAVETGIELQITFDINPPCN